MNDDTQSTEVGTESTESAAKAEKQLANIVRGTLPKALVYLIRFGDKDAKEADVAKQYGTTSGKVADILKGRNFAYIDEEFKPTQEDKDAALKWLKQVPDYDVAKTDDVVNLLDKMPVADEAAIAALAAKRAQVRARNAASSGDATGDAKPTAAKSGGGKSKSGGKGGKGGKEVTQADADSLMS